MGGWGFVCLFKRKGKWHQQPRCGSEIGSTVNRMELKAVIEALKYLKTSRSCIIYTDSRYVTTNISDNLSQWLKQDFKTSNGEIKNKDLWLEIAAELKPNVSIVWIKTRKVKTAHSQYNQIAHFLAKAMTKQDRE